MTRSQAVEAIERSGEYLSDLVQALYSTYLDRFATPSEASGWVKLLSTGVPGQTLVDLFGRPVDSAAQATWNLAMAGGMSRTQLAASLAVSGEGRADPVRYLYERYLRRVPSAAEVSGWVVALDQGAVDAQVVGSLIGSPEYYGRFAS